VDATPFTYCPFFVAKSKEIKMSNEFLESLPEDIRGNEHLANFENAEGLAKSYVETKSADFKSLLSDDVKENEHLKDIEDVNGLAQKFVDLSGNQPVIPESSDGYTFEFPKDYTPDEADLKVFQDTALKVRLTQEQYDAVMNHDMARMNRISKSLQENQEKAKAELTKEYGADYNANIEKAKLVMKRFGSDELAQRVDIGDDPGIMKMLVEISKIISEDILVHGKQPPVTNALKTAADGTRTLDYSNPVRGGIQA
jgi:hypothetical protein